MSARLQNWARICHVYVSMVALLVVLFFGLSGITLNHPDWSFGMSPSVQDRTGTLPVGARSGSDQTRLLAVSEFLRSEVHVRGNIEDFAYDGSNGTIAYRGPGYLADVSFDTSAGTYQAHIEEQGVIGVLNDLHKGRNADSSWRWLIDLAGGFLVVIALSGIILQLLLRRRRRAAVTVASLAAVFVVVVAMLNLR
ncbi:MAG: PepSY-associated TM helix domain-containing protein [Acidimicrobiales bacterium]|nr:PepSY-associated TM helix domain-containing protein [Acidimicrobiales bacterium]